MREEIWEVLESKTYGVRKRYRFHRLKRGLRNLENELFRT